MADDEKEVSKNNIDIDDQNPTVAVISILGQQARFPVNLSLVFIIIVLVSGLVAIEKISRGVTNTINAVMTGNIVQLSKEAPEGGKPLAARTYMFWTPGVDTWKDMVHSCHGDKKCLRENEKWKSKNLITHDTLEKFGISLKEDLGLQGYTRFSVVGSGSKSGDKSGWWWRIVVIDNEMDKQDFLKLYQKYFKRDRVNLEESIVGG